MSTSNSTEFPTLESLAQGLKAGSKKVCLIYAFNGTGKTRLSEAFNNVLQPKVASEDESPNRKLIYFNSYTEDLFYWASNDKSENNEPLSQKLKIWPNSFTARILELVGRAGGDGVIANNFLSYTRFDLTPKFEYKGIDNKDIDHIKFLLNTHENLENASAPSISNGIKISKGEESCFIWSMFFTFLQELINIRNESPEECNELKLNDVSHVFIDDPISSLDDPHLISVAVDLANLIKSSSSTASGIKFIITTHNPLFFNILFNELSRNGNCNSYTLEKTSENFFELKDTKDSPFSYHLFLLKELIKVIDGNGHVLQKYHLNFLRNILEKTATFLGYEQWSSLLPEDSFKKLNVRHINSGSHLSHSGDELAVCTTEQRDCLIRCVNHLIEKYGFNREINKKKVKK